jgi:hypothetical protein
MTYESVQNNSVTIYRVENLVNGKAYIGQTKATVAKRLNQHWYAAKRGISNPFHKALRKYGRSAFTISPVLICDGSMANYYEHAVLKMYGCYAHNKAGYNVADPLNHFSSINDCKGEKHPMARLNESDILYIRADTNLSHSDVAEKYSIAYGHVKSIRSGRAWAEVGGLRPLTEYKKDKKTGENHPNCVVSDAIRALIKSDTMTNSTALARLYGIDKSLIYSIRGAQPHIKKINLIDDKIAQYALDHPDVANSKLSKELGISVATISRIKNGKQFSHLMSNATEEQWAAFRIGQQRATGLKKEVI